MTRPLQSLDTPWRNPLTSSTPEPHDAELVAATRRGDTDAYAVLYRRHAPAVARAVGDNVADREERLDVVQEAFVRALDKLDGLRDDDHFRPWLLQIARNAAIDHRRKRLAFSPQSIDTLVEPPAGLDPGPELLAEVAELAGRVQDGLATLSPRDATAVGMAAHLGFGPTEIGAALGITPNNAKVVLHRARRRLRSAIEQGDAVAARVG